MLRALLPFAIVFTMVSCSTSENDEALAPMVENFSYSAVELDLMNQINSYRESVGLNALELIIFRSNRKSITTI